MVFRPYCFAFWPLQLTAASGRVDVNVTFTEPLNVALIGYGYAGKTLHAPLIGCAAGLRLVCVVSSESSKVTKDWPSIPVLADPAEVFRSPDIDLVVIATPNHTHFDLAQRALCSGKHVVVEKPLATTFAEAELLTTEARTSGQLLSVFQNRRWDGDFLTVRRILSEHRLGEVLCFESHFDRYRPKVRTRWRETPGPGSGLWNDLGAHLADQALQLFGSPEAIYADFESQRSGATVNDYFHVLLRYGRKRVLLHGSSMVLAETPRFRIDGTLGSFVKYGMDPQEGALVRGEAPRSPDWGHDPNDGTLVTRQGDTRVTESVPTISGDYPAYYEMVLDAIRNHRSQYLPAAEILTVMRLLEVGSQSAVSRRELCFRPNNRERL
jgi:predicted dehydrogenase